ncbi:MAG TPA: sensor histidine kinase [Vicinamibacterales bacterium]|nr:sensor histidine kinase [Vicinamibacterales bacterium]
MNRRFPACAAALLIVLVVCPSAAAQVRRVLLLQSLDRGNLTMDELTGRFRLELARRSPEPVTVMQAVVNPSGFDVSLDQPIVDYLSSAYVKDRKPDLVVTIGGPAATFARKHRAELFPDTPLLFASVDERFLRDRPLDDSETAVACRLDVAVLVDDILRVLPDTSTVFVVTGAGPLGRFWQREMKRDFQRFRGRVSFVWSDQLEYAQILRRVGTLPPHSAIYFLTFGTDAHGGLYPEGRVLQELRAAANAPMFGSLIAMMGHGIVGGTLMDSYAMAVNTADAAIRILNGESPAHVKTPIQKLGPPVFDWRELQRWRVDERRLPAGSIVRYREPTLWQRYKWVLIAGLTAIIGQGLLIGALLIHRTKLRRAEQFLRSNVADLHEARGALSQLSGRLMQAQEQERTRLARELHDDIVQRMSFLAMDVERLHVEIPPDATDAIGHVQEMQESVVALTQDVQGISHRLHSSKIEVLGLRAAAGSFCKEVAGRYEMNIDYTHGHVPADLPENVAISVFRVLQEAVSNVVKHAGARHCQVSLGCTNHELHLEVVDDGRGFNVQRATRSEGLGLISMRERLKLVDGEIVIESAVGRGTAVRATVSLASPVQTAQQEPRSQDANVSSTTA